MSMADTAFALQAIMAQPVIGGCEARAAMIVLAIVYAHGPAVSQNRAIGGCAIRHAGDELGEMKRCVGVVADAQQQHLAVMLMHAPDRAFRDMRRQRQRINKDRLGQWANGRESLKMVATANLWQAPEHIGSDAQIAR